MGFENVFQLLLFFIFFTTNITAVVAAFSNRSFDIDVVAHNINHDYHY